MLADLAPEQAFIPEDEVPLPPVQCVTVIGDVWISGDHRLLCGDSTQAESFVRLLQGQAVDILRSVCIRFVSGSWR